MDPTSNITGQVPPRPGASSHGTAFRADIQGLRAVAVLSVVIYHAHPALLGGGFVGVDVFFVISGYLITGILLKDIDRGTFSLSGFYERRVRRLFPALYLMLAASLLAGLFLLAPHDYREMAHTAVSTVFFVSNFDFATMYGYFDGDSTWKPLLHTWSLAVEEQFYIVFPIVLYAIRQWAGQRLASFLTLAAAASLIASAWTVRTHPVAAFYFAPLRAFELLIGAVVAVRPPSADGDARVRDALSLVGLALIAAAIVLFDETTPFPGLAALVPCAGAGLVIYAGARAASLGGRLLSLPPFVFFGGLSYSLYLWHWPILIYTHHVLADAPTPFQASLCVSAAIVAAWLSWRFVERPFQTRPAPRRRVLALGAAAMALGAVVSGMVVVNNGMPSRFDARTLALFASADDYNRRRNDCHSLEDTPIPYEKNCRFGAPGVAPTSAVWGDSHGAELVVALGDRLAARGQAITQITASACPPAMDYQPSGHQFCADHNRETLTRLTSDGGIHAVVIAINFAFYPEADWDVITAGLARAVESLTRSGKSVVLVYPIPIMRVDPPTTLGMMSTRGGDLATWGLPVDAYRAASGKAAAFLDALATKTGAGSFHPSETLCDANVCHAYDPAVGAFYFDHEHLSVTGARYVARTFPLARLVEPN